MEKLMELMKRSEVINKEMQIAALQFDSAVSSGDVSRQEETRLKIHTLIDDSLDLKLEIENFKNSKLSQLKRKY
jgi:hypothetical protein